MLCFIYLIAISQASNDTCRVPDCLTCSLSTPFLCNNCNLGYERSPDGCIKSQSPQESLIENCYIYTLNERVQSASLGTL